MTYEFTNDWFSGLTGPWLEHVVPRLPRPFSWLEIGSHEGMSACWLLDNVVQPGDTLTCVDVWAGAFNGVKGEGAEARFDANVAGRVEKHKCRSHEFLARAVAAGRLFDGVYIDGDHHAHVVIEDSVLAWRVLRPGGVLVWDDYRWTRDGVVPPGPAIDAFVALYGERVEVLHRDWQVIVVKRGGR